MLLIYTPNTTTRLGYIMDHIFKDQFGIDYSITNSREKYLNTEQEKFSYAAEDPGQGLYFFADGLLTEDGIKKTELHEGVYNGVPVLFSHNKEAALIFDIFSAIFYLISRYEEYLNEPTGMHGNYDYRHSILYKLNILDKPIVDGWVNMLKEVLLKKYPSLSFKESCPRFALTFDIDVAYAYSNRSILRITGGIAKKLITLQLKALKDQLLTLIHSRRDIFDTYNYIFSKTQNNKALFFFNMGKYGKYDKNPSFNNKRFRELIKRIQAKAIVGLHPSYASNSNEKLLKIEKSKLEKITNKKITSSRQHYLKIKLPGTYRNLIAHGIEKDFTMGYYYTYGFRAGTCNSFLFFDLVKNETTNLRLYPFAVMEGTLNDVLKLDINEAKKTVSNLIDIIHLYNGIFIPLWHNSTLCDTAEWKGWREVFECMIDELKGKNFHNLF